MKKVAFAILLGFAAGFCHAQDVRTVYTPDRPGALADTGILPLHKLAWEGETGIESRSGGPRTWTINSSQLRFGLFEDVELRVGADFLMVRDTPDANPQYGLAPLNIELKARFYEGSGILPSVGLLAGLVSSHVGSKWLLPSHLTPAMCLLFDHTVNDRWGINYNIGVQWDGETPTPSTFLGLGIICNITESVGTYIESYNYLHPVEPNQYMTGFGLTWMVSDRLQLDLSADLDLQHLGSFYAVNLGFAWLLN